MYKIILINAKQNNKYDFYLGSANKTLKVEKSVLANPFRSKKDDTQTLNERYRKYIEQKLLDPMSDESEEIDFLTDYLQQNKELTLACTCLPKACHIEIVAELLTKRIQERESPPNGNLDALVEINKESYQKAKKVRYKFKQNPLSSDWGETWNQQTCQICDKCPLHLNRTNTVFIRGQGEKRLMIVGEAPGKNEDECGLPFIGDSGKMLEKVLASVGLDSQRDCWIVNAVKCRPPENRTPTTDETDTCFPYLQRQIVDLEPKVILALGNTSTKRLIGIGNFKIGIYRGKQLQLDLSKWGLPDKELLQTDTAYWEYLTNNGMEVDTLQQKMEMLENIIVVPTYHPSYLLRNPQLDVGSPKWYVWQDIQIVAKLLE